MISLAAFIHLVKTMPSVRSKQTDSTYTLKTVQEGMDWFTLITSGTD